MMMAFQPSGRAEHRLWRGSKATLMLTVANLLIGVFQVRLLLQLWGAESYAAWMVVVAAISLLGSLDNGLTTYVGNEITRSWTRGQAAIRLFLASGILASISLAAGALLLTAGLIISGHPSALFGGELTGDLSLAASAGLLLYLVYWSCLGCPAGLLGKIYAPAGQFERYQWISIVQRLAGFSALLLAATCGMGICGAMAAQCLAHAAIQSWMLVDLKKRFPHLFPLEIRGVYPQAWRDFRASLRLCLVAFAYQAGFGGFTLLASHHLEPVLVAAFSVQRTAANLFLQISAVLLHPLSPELVRYHETGEREKLLPALRMACLLVNSSGLFLLLTAIGLAPWVFAVWTGGKVPYLKELFYLLAFATAVRLWASPFVIYLQGINALSAQLKTECLRSGFGLGLAFILLPHLGLNALGWGCALGETVGACFVWRESQRILPGGPSRDLELAAGLAVAQVVVFLMVLGSAIHVPEQALGVGFFGGCVICVLGFRSWKKLPNHLSARLLSPFKAGKIKE